MSSVTPQAAAARPAPTPASAMSSHERALRHLDGQSAAGRCRRLPGSARTCSTRSGWASWRPERFTLMRRRIAGELAATRCIWRQDSSSTQRPSGTMRPVSSATGMNSRAGPAPLGMLPAHQRLEAGQLARGEVDDGLVVEDRTRCALERAAQVGLDAQLRSTARRCMSASKISVTRRARWPWPGTWRCRRRAASSSGSARSAGPTARCRCWRCRRPRSRRRRTAPPAPRWIRSATRDGVGARCRDPRAGWRTRRRPGGPGCRPGAGERSRRRAISHQQLVAGVVAEAVVDPLEAVEVEVEHRERQAGRPGARPGGTGARAGSRTGPGWAGW